MIIKLWKTRQERIEESILSTAYRALNKRHRVLAPQSAARIIWRDFDPCRAVQPIANVEWPATVNMRNVVLTHVVMDGDQIINRSR